MSHAPRQPLRSLPPRTRATPGRVPPRTCAPRSSIGASKIGATVYDLPPGQSSFPYHYEYGCEEWLLVVEGRPTLRHPGGEDELEPGDLVCFPEGPEGAHKVTNETDETARIMILSTKGDSRRAPSTPTATRSASSTTENDADQLIVPARERRRLLGPRGPRRSGSTTFGHRGLRTAEPGPRARLAPAKRPVGSEAPVAPHGPADAGQLLPLLLVEPELERPQRLAMVGEPAPLDRPQPPRRQRQLGGHPLVARARDPEAHGGLERGGEPRRPESAQGSRERGPSRRRPRARRRPDARRRGCSASGARARPCRPRRSRRARAPAHRRGRRPA